MDSPADALLALSNTAAAIAGAQPTTTAAPIDDDDDRSSSLSELDDAPDVMDFEADDADNSDAEDEQDPDEEEDEAEDEDEDEEEDRNEDLEQDHLMADSGADADADETKQEPELPTNTIPSASTPNDPDSEAETERIEDSPDKTKRTFQTSPSKLAQSMNASDDVRPEIEELTNSDVSSPISPIGDSPLDDLSDLEDAELSEPANALDLLSQAAATTNKRKRLSDVMDIGVDQRPTKRRSDSLSEPEDDNEEDEDAESDADSEGEKTAAVSTKSKLVESINGMDPQLTPAASAIESSKALPSTSDENAIDDVVDPDANADAGANPEHVTVEDDKDESSDTSKTRKTEQYTRARSRRGKELIEDAADDHEAAASDVDPEPDDAEVVAKSEEEHARRSAAVDALTSLEQHFASLRDRLYDEKIAQINRELTQLSAPEPDHPELLRQFDCVHKYRDDKQQVEQTLLVYKIGALKRKSVAERSQTHSAYFQTIRDVRERHMERMSEHFYRIQRQRWKSTQVAPTYTIPFPEKRVTQVAHQTSYNKEVSVLSGVAKYVGFPAAPKLNETPDAELNADLQRMGINSSASRLRNAAQGRNAGTSTGSLYSAQNLTAAISSSAAAASSASEQQFIESTPWANPNHPIHRLGRPTANKSPFSESFATTAPTSNPAMTTTPAHQRRNGTEATPAPIGSASTIVENPSMEPTPTQTEAASSNAKPGMTGVQVNGQVNHRPHEAVSPSETRRTISNMLQAGATAAAAQQRSRTPASESNGIYLGVNSSPLQARASLLSNLNRTASATGMRDSTRSPFRQDLVASAGGMGRFGFR